MDTAKVAGALVLLVLAQGCGSPGQCSLQPVVVLTDAKTGQAICNATVVASPSGEAGDDGGGAGLSFVVGAGGPKGCAYYAHFGDSAPYSLDISAPGYAPYSFAGVQPVTVPCNQVASPASIEIALSN